MSTGQQFPGVRVVGKRRFSIVEGLKQEPRAPHVRALGIATKVSVLGTDHRGGHVLLETVKSKGFDAQRDRNLEPGAHLISSLHGLVPQSDAQRTKYHCIGLARYPPQECLVVSPSLGHPPVHRQSHC